MIPFTHWLSQTSISLAIQTHDWVIPTIQSVHIVAIGVVLTSVFMTTLRILGWAGRDQSLRETTGRFGPWWSGGLLVLLVTGILMVIGEPARELLAFSFWLKMGLVAAATIIAVAFRISLRKQEWRWEESLPKNRVTKWLAIATLLIWLCIVILGRLIAYDHVWGSWSTARTPPLQALAASCRGGL